MELTGIIGYVIFFLSLAGIYALLALGLNVQWGYTGMLNIGIAAFFAVGAYTSAILTSPATAVPGGFGLPIALGMVAAMVTSGVLAVFIGLITLRLRTDYLAIASIGIAEIVRLFLKNEAWLTNGVRGMAGIPKPLAGLVPGADALLFLAMVVGLILLVYWANERAYRSPWGRVLRAIREKEIAAGAMGKNTLVFRLQAFVFGSSVMGLAGAVYAHFAGFISPEAFDPLFATFVVWVMLIAGGSGNNRGAILGAVVIWGVWSLTEFLTGMLPADFVTQAAALRIFLIGLLLQVILLSRPQGLLPERQPRPLREGSD
ncbi:MAG: branched-chain amino acid ABC transporter permease [Candidatus Competibacterales bacterium]|nr:branched-chain amino acid ABC transporter permease [Candidatus Competibacterales bacterium]